MPFAALPDARLFYQFDGPEHAPVLLFSNSLGATHQMWNTQLGDFSKHFRVLRYDTRGHGQSTVTPGPYTITQLSSDVLDLLDALNIQQAFFCGLSMGGMTGMFLGSRASARFHKLVLANTAAKIGTAETWNVRVRTVRDSGMNSIAVSVMERWLTEPFRATHREQTAELLAMVQNANSDGYIANCAAVRDTDYRAELGAIKVPTLVVSGTDDPVTPPADGRFLAQHIPAARFVELRAAHLSNIEAQSEFNREVLSFLRA